MPIRTGAEFLASLQDGREVWLEGERVDVTTDPRMAGCATSLAEIYDLQHDPAHRDLLTMASPTTGSTVSLGYILPETAEGLARRRRMIEFLMRRTGGVAGRLPEYMASIMVGLWDTRDLLAEKDATYAANVTAYFDYCRENDLALTHGFVDPPRDRKLPRDPSESFRVVDRRSDGIVVRGAKAVATLAPYSNEFLSLTAHRPDILPDEIVYFGIAMNAPGIKMICRPPLGHPPSADHVLSARYDEMDAWVIFDDVFIPWERVFYLGGVERNAEVFRRVLIWASHHILIRMEVKAEVLLGICAAMADYLGTATVPSVHDGLCEAIAYVETLRAFAAAAERKAFRTSSGLLAPDSSQVVLGRIYGVEHHPRMLQLIREISGSGILMAPGEAELRTPEIRPDVDRYLVGQDQRAPDRFRMLKLAWEYAVDSFGSRQLLFEMYNASTLAVNRGRLMSSYDTSPFIRLAKEVAGIDPEP